MNRNIFFILFFALSLVACDKDKVPNPIDPVMESNIVVNPVYNGQPLFLDSIYTAPNGYKIKVTDILFYVTKLGYQNNVFSEAGLYDFREKGNVLLSVNKDHTLFPSLQGVLGVDTAYNHQDPSAFPNGSPLNISNAGTMHWGWNPGYIFINIEGKADTLIDGVDQLDLSFSYHVGTDAFLQNLNFQNIVWQSTGGNQHSFLLNLDLYQFFFNPTQPISINTEYFTHSGAGYQVLTQKAASNFLMALTPP